MSEVNELFEPSNETNIIGCDVNYKRVVFSNNKFYNIKKLAHRKIEHKNITKRKEISQIIVEIIFIN